MTTTACDDQLSPDTSTPEEDEEFERIQARQDADKSHEADARLLDAQLADAIQFRRVAPSANNILNAAAQHMQDRAATYDKPEGEISTLCCADISSPDDHYRHEYKGIKLDPYRIANIYNMNGGPREQIMKKCLRFTDKGQTEQQVINEIRSALDRWQQMLDEDQ